MLKKLSRLLLVASLLIAFGLSAQQKTKAYDYSYTVDEDGNTIKMMRYAGKPPKELPPVVQLPKTMKTGEKGAFWLNNVPSYTWCYGCTATATAIFNGYFDSFGAPGVYTGPENGGVQPMTNTWTGASQTGTDQCPVAGSKEGIDGRASRGHGDDYWTNYGDEATDPYYGNWAEHDHEAGQPSTADFMGTNQWYNWENSDGSTTMWSSSGGVYDYAGSEGSTPALRDGIHGMRLFYESMGMTVQKNYTRTITGYDDPDDDPDMGPATGGYEFSMYKASIDAGRPVLIGIEGHSMVGFGYDDTNSPETLYLRDTWDTNTSNTAHSMIWGEKYSNMTHYAISEVVLGTEEYWAAPENIFALNNNQVVTITWDDPAPAKNITYKILRDGSEIGTTADGDLDYVDSGASDGVHVYKIIAVYIDDTVDSYPSLGATVFVSISVTEFHDDFEIGGDDPDDQWLLFDGWGIDTDFFVSGARSLSESPGGNYSDGSDQLAAGGSVGEIAPGLNFTTAADIELDFWFRYDIELSFDYMHLQTCKDGINWVSIKIWDGEGVGWYQEIISLGLFAGESNVRMRFLFISDPGYNTEGSNIDDINITPSLTDTSPPYVYYTKELDYYSAYPDGFEISTEITDFTGVQSADVLYKVNGGGEVTAGAPFVAGDTYSWTLPQFNPGDLVEFRFDCTDDLNTQGYVGPFYYRDGLQQKYDFGTVSFYTEVTTGTAQYDYKSYAVQFSSFHDDIVGCIVRGYDDVSQPEDNAQMLINVWADNAGLPGATLITPIAYDNPATLSATNAWGYVDLSSYTALDDIAGDYYIGFECGDNPATGVTRTNMTDTGTAFEFDFGRAWMQLYLNTGADLTWELQNATNHHIRCITTNNGAVPGILNLSPGTLVETLLPDGSSIKNVDVQNIGGYSLDYAASIEFISKSKGVIEENNFNTGIGWTPSGDQPWSAVSTLDGGSIDGSDFAKVEAKTNGSASTRHAYLTSGQVNLSTATAATFAFDQKKSTSSSTGAIEASNDGSAWTEIYSTSAVVGAWNNPDQQNITIPATYFTATAQFRCHASLPKSSGYWAVDNIVIDATTTPPWLTVDGSATTSGTVAASGSDPMSVEFDATGLAEGVYTALIKLTSDNSNENVSVQLTVENATLPDPTTLVFPTDASTISDHTPDFDWATIVEASSYDVIVDNNADFLSPEIDENVVGSGYTPAADLADGTYYWKARSRNAAGASVYTSTWTVILASPNITLSEVAVAGTGDLGGVLTDSDIFDIGNTGAYDLDYAMSIDYVVAKGTKADIDLLSNDFNSALGWGATGTLAWTHTTDANNLDGSSYASVIADPVADPNGTQAGTLTTAVFNGTASYAVFVDFDQYAELLTSLCIVEYTTDGSTWVEFYSNAATVGAWGTPDHQRVQVPVTSATMQLRFIGSFKNQTGSSWNIDNVEITGLNPANFGWLTAVNSMLTTSGTIIPAGSDQIDVSYDATGMDPGTYDANITVTSTDPDEPVKVIAVQFVVTGGTIIPAVPANVVTSIVSGDIVFDWDDSVAATEYDVYSSDDPYGTFAYVTSVVPSTYTVAADQAKLFYYFVATNATKVADKTAQKLSKDRHKKDDSGR